MYESGVSRMYEVIVGCGYRKGLRRSHSAGELDEIPKGGGHVGAGLDQSGQMHLRPIITNNSNTIKHAKHGGWVGVKVGALHSALSRATRNEKKGTGAGTSYRTLSYDSSLGVVFAVKL